MKDTPLLKLLDEIEGYRPIAGTDPFPYIIAKLQSLLPYERECIDDAYRTGFENGLYKNPIGHEAYIKNNFNQPNPQGGGVE